MTLGHAAGMGAASAGAPKQKPATGFRGGCGTGGPTKCLALTALRLFLDPDSMPRAELTPGAQSGQVETLCPPGGLDSRHAPPAAAAAQALREPQDKLGPVSEQLQRP